MNQLPAIVQPAAAKLPTRALAASAPTLSESSGRAQGLSQLDIELRRVGGGMPRYSRYGAEAELEDRFSAPGSRVNDRRGYDGYARAVAVDSRFAAQILGQPGAVGAEAAKDLLQAEGTEAYRRAGAEPSLAPATAQLVSLQI